MTTKRSRITIPLAIVLALASAPALTGCFGNPVQGLVNSATGGGIGNASIPSDFPSSVPVYKGKVVSSFGLGSGKKKIWNLSIQVPDAKAMTQIKSELAGAGFKADGEGELGKVGSSLIADNKKYGVVVVLAKSGSSFLANYTVTPAGSDN